MKEGVVIMKIRQSAADRIFMFFTYGLLLLFSLIVAYPIYFMCIASVSDPNAVMRGEVIFWFKDFTSLGYERIFSNDTIFRRFDKSGNEVIIVCNFARQSTLIITHLNADRRVINAGIHDERKAAGELKGDPVTVSILETVFCF